MKLRSAYLALKHMAIGLLCLALAGFLFACLREVAAPAVEEEALEAIPNYNYVPDIRQLQAERKWSEALEMARFVQRHPDMPGQEEARQLEAELNAELTSLWGRSKRVASGFVLGSGSSIEEISGGIVSDMIVYGDVRDLVKQGYYKVTGGETDGVIAALAGVGLLTELVDVADWAPAVLKAFRKVGALTQRFADFIVSACKSSVKAGKLEDTLKIAFKQLQNLVDKLGLARTSTVFAYVDASDDLRVIAKVAEKNADAAYFTVRNGGKQGVDILKRLGDSEAGVKAMGNAARKGPRGVAWLARGGAGRKHLIRARFGARFLKNLRMERPQQFVTEIARQYPSAKRALWTLTALAAFLGLAACAESLWRLQKDFRKKPPEPNPSAPPGN